VVTGEEKKNRGKEEGRKAEEKEREENWLLGMVERGREKEEDLQRRR
jgi:hypothetical protein